LKISTKKSDDKGNITTRTENSTIALDKLSIKCYAKDRFLNKLFKLISSREYYSITPSISIAPNFSHREKGYRHTVDIHYFKETFLHISFSPVHDGVIHNQVKVVIENHVLYEQDWIVRMEKVLHSLNLECLSITELHIALDASNLAKDLLSLYYDSPLKIVREGFDGRIEGKRLAIKSGFIYNSRESDVYFSFYDKSGEAGIVDHYYPEEKAN
jgi:hypothetical protein